MELYEVVGSIRRLELMRRIMSRRLLSNLGLHPGQPPMIEYVIEHPGCTQKNVADELDITPASAASSLKRLEKAGIIRRETDRNDCRCNRLYVTELGIQKSRDAREAFNALDIRMFEGISDDERVMYKQLCERMFENMADETTRGLTICKLHSAADNIFSQQEEDN
ncbi:MAG: hypothetical protein CW338_10860 [Clostridiales bacterium]|nr:hypothetical protein [Clostridiales bacterium]